MNEKKRLQLDIRFAEYLSKRVLRIEALGVDYSDPRSYRRWREADAAYQEHLKRVGRRWRKLMWNPLDIGQGDWFNGAVIVYRILNPGKEVKHETVRTEC